VRGPIATSSAAGLARAHNGGGCTDWYLPSKDEPNRLYLSKGVIGGLVDVCCWISSQSDAVSAWAQYFADGHQHLDDKSFANRVRAVPPFEPRARAGRDGRGGAQRADRRGRRARRPPAAASPAIRICVARGRQHDKITGLVPVKQEPCAFVVQRLPRAGVAAQ